MVRRIASLATAGERSTARRQWRTIGLGLLIAVPVLALEALLHGEVVLTPGLVAISVVLGLVTAWVLEQELDLAGMLRRTGLLRRPSQDRVTLGGLALWVAGTIVAATAGADDPARGLASAIALGGLSGWAGGPLRTAVRRRLAGERGILASVPALIVLALGTLAAVVTLVAAIALWATA